MAGLFQRGRNAFANFSVGNAFYWGVIPPLSLVAVCSWDARLAFSGYTFSQYFRNSSIDDCYAAMGSKTVMAGLFAAGVLAYTVETVVGPGYTHAVAEKAKNAAYQLGVKIGLFRPAAKKPEAAAAMSHAGPTAQPAHDVQTTSLPRRKPGGGVA